MAPHVSRFVARLFRVEGDAVALSAATRAQDDLFRFKIDFVRRRALPLLKGGATVVADAADDEVVQRLIDEQLGHGLPDPAAEHRGAAELALARAGCALLDREKSDKAAVAPAIESLKRWCAARLHDRRYRDWVVFRFPETLDYWHLVDVRAAGPRRWTSSWSAPTSGCAAATGSS